MEKLVQDFTESGTVKDALALLRFCRLSDMPNIGIIHGKHVSEIFEDNEILFELAEFYFDIKDYKSSFNILQKLLEKQLTEKEAKMACIKQNKCIEFISNEYTGFLRIPEKNPFPLITVTITSCKRYKLFEQTINSFINCCKDIHLVHRWLCIDDNSNEQDQAKMKQKYPFIEFYFKSPSEKGHPKSMNIIKKEVKTPYFFHLEDDFKFFTPYNYLTHCLDVLQEENIGQCLINKNYAETEKDINIKGGIFRKTKNQKRYYVHEHLSDMEYFRKYRDGLNCAYWPHFSLRPSLIRTQAIKETGDFSETAGHFEMEYGFRWIKNYVSAFLEGIYCLHIGRLTSERHTMKKNAYDLNNQVQFKDENTTIKTFVINLKRRSDRWEKFVKQDVGFLNYTRFPAIDGRKLQPTEELQFLFDGNDYNMTAGRVGCALSHINLYTHLLKSKHDIYCILEDDIEVAPKFQKRFTELLGKLQEKDWDLCYLGHHLWKPEKRFSDKPITLEKRDSVKSLLKSMGGTGGYLITKRGAEKLLNFINDTGMINCIDTMQQKSANILNLYYCDPHLIFSEPHKDSDIEREKHSLTIPLLTRYKNMKKMYVEKGKIPVEIKEEKDLEPYLKKENKKIVFYSGPNVQKVRSICQHACYLLSNRILIITPGEEKKERLKTGNKFKFPKILFI